MLTPQADALQRLSPRRSVPLLRLTGPVLTGRDRVFAAPARASANEPPVAKQRPVYLDLVRIRMPLPAIVSILHRISGAALFLVGIPVVLLALQRSLSTPDLFAAFRTAWANPLAKLIAIGLIWAYLHHFCAGIRYLLLDMHVGDNLKPARQSSVLVLAVSIALTLIIGARLW